MSKEEGQVREPRMPTTLPSPVDRGEFRFVAVDASGEAWPWVDEKMVWMREPGGLQAGASDPDGLASAR